MATASADTSIKILSVPKLLTYNQAARNTDGFELTKPVRECLSRNGGGA